MQDMDVGPQDVSRDGKPARILNAALEVFAERGVHGVAVPEIASRAGVGTGTIYRYFPSKEALVNQLFRREKQRIGALLMLPHPPEATPRERYDEFWSRMVQFARQHPFAFRFLELQDHRSYLDDESLAVERSLLGPMVDQLRRMQQGGVCRDDVRRSLVLAVTWGAFVNLFKAEQLGYMRVTPADIRAARDACWRMFQPT